ncbi:MAG: hypothetical protein H7257_05615, partial [Taibaiella sp.]|nr:hypothetical protein [Taibaiella sp.]
MSAKKKNTPVTVTENVSVPNTATPPQATMGPDFFETYSSKMPLIVFALLLIGVIIVFKDYIFFDKHYFFKDIGSDSINFSYPVMYHIANYMGKYGLPKWSFSMGMGQSAFPFM